MKKLIYLFLIICLLANFETAYGQTIATKSVSKVQGSSLITEKIPVSYEELISKLEKTTFVYDNSFEVWKSKTGVLYAIKKTDKGVLKKRLPKLLQ